MGRLGWIVLGIVVLFLIGVDFWLGYGFGRLSALEDLKRCLSQKMACECTY